MEQQPKFKFELLAWRLICAGSILTVILLILFLMNRKYSFELPIENDVFGQFGDIVGGLVGSLISLVSVFLLFETLSQQRIQFSDQQDNTTKALTTQREQFDQQQLKSDLFFKREQIENRFFELLKIHRENANAISIGEKQGRKIFITLERELNYTFTYVRMANGECRTYLSLNDMINVSYLCFFYGAVGDKSEKTIKNALKNYDSSFVKNLIGLLNKHQATVQNDGEFLYKPFVGYQSRLSHYFRNLYQTIKYINQIDKSILDYTDKYSYVSTLRAQLTTHEQVLVFWNSLSDLGKAWEINRTDENLKLITKYNLTKNIPYGFIRDFEPKDFYNNVAYEGEDEPLIRAELKSMYN